MQYINTAWTALSPYLHNDNAYHRLEPSEPPGRRAIRSVLARNRLNDPSFWSGYNDFIDTPLQSADRLLWASVPITSLQRSCVTAIEFPVAILALAISINLYISGSCFTTSSCIILLIEATIK
jgi:hypothetical protein